MLENPSHLRFWKALALVLAFLFRLSFGFFANMEHEDQRQIYLIGLKYYCTGLWPYFGADVLPHIQIPGALQGLAVGLPLRIWPAAESPFVFVNLLSFAALCLFGWYCSKRLPTFPKWILWGWLFTAPWVLNCSTNVYNVSYVLFGSIVFFIGFLETVPALAINAIPAWLANLMMGFAFFWNAQFHMSYITLAPFLVVSAIFQMKQTSPGDWFRRLALFLLGAATTGVFMVPTFLRYGMDGLGGTGGLIRFNPTNIGSFFVILAQLFSLASAEIPRFVGRNTAQRLAFLRSQIWMAPFFIATLLLGLLQPIVMLASGLRRVHPQKDWRAIKVLAFSTFLLVYLSFVFAVKNPASHTYYLMLPVFMLFAFYVFSPWSSNRRFRIVAGVLLICNLVFHLGLAFDNYKERSLFADRDSILKAIEAKDYRLMGERRPEAWY
jgi:hypothetical protein